MKVMEMTQKELTEAIATGLSSVVKERCDQIDSRVNALAESLSRRLDVLEKQAGPVGRPPSFQGVWQQPAMGSGSSDSDSKDALIRDLYREFLHPTGTTPGVLYEARAEKLGVKL